MAGFPAMLASQAIQVVSVPTGAQPMGLAIVSQIFYSPFGSPIPADHVVVANSGDASVSVFDYSGQPQLFTTIRGVSDPHAIIADCGNSSFRFIVTSPADNSVSFVQVDSASSSSISKVSVGSQPVSAACFQSNGKAVIAVSNYADHSVTLIDDSSLTVTATIPEVPGSPGLHGIGDVTGASPVAWIAGTDANVVTLLDINSQKVVSQILVDHPVSIQGTQVATTSAVLSFDAGTLQPTTLLAVPGIQLLQSAEAQTTSLGSALGTATFGVIGDLTMSSLVLFSTREMFSQPQVVSPQDMAAEQSASCTPSFGNCVRGSDVLLVTSRDSNSLIQLIPPALPQGFLAYSAADRSGLAPGGLGSIFAMTGVTDNFSVNSLPLPVTLSNVTLRIGGSAALTPSGWVYNPVNSITAPLLFLRPNQINFQVPPGFVNGNTVLGLERPDGTTLLTWTSQIPVTNPAIFSLDGSGSGPGAVLNQDNSVNSPANPASRGSVIQIFATGGGDITPLLGPGEAAPTNGDAYVQMNITPLVLIGSKADQAANGPGELLFNGLAPGLVGVWQINARIPENTTPGTNVPLSLLVGLPGGYVGSNGVTIAVK